MKQIRVGVFETNSSSTHSLTILTKTQYDEVMNGDAKVLDCWTFDVLKRKGYTGTRYVQLTDLKKMQDLSDLLGRKITDDDFSHESEDLESYCEEFTTPSGDQMVAFGQYGYNG